MRSRLITTLTALVAVGGIAAASPASGDELRSAPLGRVATADLHGRINVDTSAGTQDDSGTFRSFEQLGIGRYRFTSTFDPSIGCNGITNYSGTARLVRNDGATLSGALTGTSQCIGAVTGLIAVNASFTLDLKSGTRDLVGAQLTADCSWPVRLAASSGVGAQDCSLSGNVNYTTILGYALLDASGTLNEFGGTSLPFEVGGDLFGASGLALTPSHEGYWTVNAAGVVHAFGDAHWFGNAHPASMVPGESVRSIAASAGGRGYWLFTTHGRVLDFGAAPRLGDLRALALKAPVVGAVAEADGTGYVMVAGDGGVFTFGRTRFFGSAGASHLNRPVVGLSLTASGRGYWLVAADGGVFAFGDARFRGSMGATHLASPVVGVTRYGNGYLMVAADGGIFNFGTLPFFGSLVGESPGAPIVGVVPS